MLTDNGNLWTTAVVNGSTAETTNLKNRCKLLCLFELHGYIRTCNVYELHSAILSVGEVQEPELLTKRLRYQPLRASSGAGGLPHFMNDQV